MKIYLIATAALALALGSCSQEEQTAAVDTGLVTNPATGTGDIDTVNVPKMEFSEVNYDFGTITQGEKVSFSYSFKNTGNRDLIISSARGSCGCTVPEYPRQPVRPGEEGKIDVVFDSEGKSGKTSKSVTIVANTYPEKTTILHLTGEILVPENELKPND